MHRTFRPADPGNEKRRTVPRGLAASAVAFGWLLAVGTPAVAAVAPTAMARPLQSDEPAQGKQVFHVSVRSDLFSPGVDLDVAPGRLSDPFALKGRGVIRVGVTPDRIDAHFGPVYRLVITDGNGKRMASMLVGNNTTATFEHLGIQVYLLLAPAAA